MIDLNYAREKTSELKARLEKRSTAYLSLVDELLVADEKRRALQKQLDDNLNEVNVISKQVGKLFQEGKKDEAEILRARSNELKINTERLQKQLNESELLLKEIAVKIPNAPHESVKFGKSPEDNEIIRSVGNIPQLPEGSLPHWELAKKYQLFDLELGVKITGAGFPVYTAQGARLQRALISFFLDEATKAGYTEFIPPLMVNADSAFATGQLPDKEGQMYEATVDALYLIPTAEVPVTNIYRDQILEEKDLPVKMCAYTPCFRREAGSYGKDVRGLNRVHQFDKVEIVRIEHPDNAYAALEEMCLHVGGLLEKLELPYRILRLCGGDMGFASALTYDFEVFSAAQQRWLEVSSTSCFETFQSNRLKLRIKDAANRKMLAYTLNGSALALPRIVASILENHQRADGIYLPQVLHPYTGFSVIR